MSTSGSSSGIPVKHKFIVYAPDKTEPGTLERRLSIRPTHIDNVKQLNKDGLILTGGAMLTPDSIAPDAPSKKFFGSVVIYEATSLEEVRGHVERDVYYTSGVWDPERIIIMPFALALPWPQN
ncbi:hypothetical protein OF83DRAFT_1061785 [Amylostereum chailletii]|nr:hypothetical protein OF83DRAFT_1061785 [Amylostereum chailletii]